ncbi:two-component system response regulator CssR [Natranaerovirga hydrolytica]|uniref:Stage 0 sporulation protein A homolog n=1 Tax=Natranaerovirga hydrolytica TaxID=680378 RepID=A0A4R1MKL3_9FIRM|nr:response regulator transcription factor [Natranaerovirga hydrolytica]TCK93266.1 two-component system response regulator CssR [Natranaerovirga hydrolytica]
MVQNSHFIIHIVEDEQHLNQLVTSYLKKEGYNVKSFTNGSEALEHINESVHLWILDIMLPDVDGFMIIKEIKEKTPDIPVIFMSARDQDLDKILGLEMGSEDYITKPFVPRELVLRVKKLLERTYKHNENNTDMIYYEEYIINTLKRVVSANNETLNLSTKEYDLLYTMLQNKQKAFSREELLNIIWGEDYFGSDRVVDDLMRRLRKKMPNLHVETLYGYGYRLL